MSLDVGTPLGPYRITRKLGAGGMGEVYAANDPRLGREVAIKVLPVDMARDQAFLRRFKQEALAVAALNHPNIVQVFDIGATEDGTPFLVMELLEGESLRVRMGGKAMPVRKVAEICAQLARALGAAHVKGIIHRDLKPENVYLIKQGPAKVLDFGLAKLAEKHDSPQDEGDDATRALFTQPGMVMGTVGYMAPEQVEGKNADARSDIFALGVVMWEMVSGARPFQRNSSIDTLHAILRDDPPEIDPAVSLPAAMERILRRCLEKDPDDRFQSAQDLAFHLENLADGSGKTTTLRIEALEGGNGKPWYRQLHRLFYPLPIRLPGRLKVCFWDRVQLSVAYLLIAGLIVTALWKGVAFNDAGSRELAKQFVLAADVTGTLQSVALSRNGLHTLVYLTDESGTAQMLYLRKGDSPVVVEDPIATEILAMSNTGTALLSSAAGDLFLMEMGEHASAMKIATHVLEADLAPDGSKIAMLRRNGSKYVIEYPQGNACFTSSNRIMGLKVSPSGDALAFLERESAAGGFQLKVWHMDGKTAVWDGKGLDIKTSSLRGTAWNRQGDGIYVVSKNLLGLIQKNGARILHREAGSLRLRGATDEGPILDVGTELILDRGRLAGFKQEQDLAWVGGQVEGLSDDGSRILVARDAEVWLLPADHGKGRKIGMGTAEAISPDGKQVLVLANDRLLAVPADGGDSRLIATRMDLNAVGFSFTGENTDPKSSFSADGKWVLVTQKQLLYRKPADGSGALEAILIPTGELSDGWRLDAIASPDGHRMAVQVRDASEQRWCMILDGDGKSTLPLAQLGEGERLRSWTQGNECLVFWSADAAAGLRMVDLKTGARRAIQALAPPMQNLTARFRTLRCASSGSYYTYRYATTGISQLVLAKGL